jgi:hypothetical protein
MAEEAAAALPAAAVVDTGHVRALLDCSIARPLGRLANCAALLRPRCHRTHHHHLRSCGSACHAPLAHRRAGHTTPSSSGACHALPVPVARTTRLCSLWLCALHLPRAGVPCRHHAGHGQSNLGTSISDPVRIPPQAMSTPCRRRFRHEHTAIPDIPSDFSHHLRCMSENLEIGL